MAKPIKYKTYVGSLDVEIFRKKAYSLYAVFDEDSDRGRARKGWLQLGALLNPEAAMDFDVIASIVESLQGRYGPDGNYADKGLRQWDPLTYIEQHQFSVPRVWRDVLRDWERDLRQNHIAAEHTTYHTILNDFQDQLQRLKVSLGKLDAHMKEECFDMHKVPNQILVDPYATQRAAQSLCVSLDSIAAALQNFVEKLPENAPSIRELQEYGRDINLKSSLRRRGRGQSSAVTQDRNQSGPSASDAPETTMWQSVVEAVQDLRTPTKIVTAVAKPSQTKLQYLSFMVSCASGIFVGIAFTIKRPQECEPQIDDSFWTLLSQTLLTLCSLYCTIIPQTRDKAVTLELSWFRLSIFSSASMAILAPVIYKWSWRASLSASYLSAFTALMASVQLAGGIRAHNQGIAVHSS